MGAAEGTKAYLDGFQHDVFISYAHQDDADNWIDDLRKTLVRLIDHHLGCRGKLSIFRDEDSLSRNQLVTHSLPVACQESAVMVCVVSANYLKSDWCRRELEAFRERLKSRPMRAKTVPIFHLTLLETDDYRDALPEPLSDLNAYAYVQAKPANPDWTKQFFLHGKEHLDQRFFNQTNRLAEDIAKTLQEIGKTQQKTLTQKAPPPPSPPPGPTDDRAVCVAEGTDDVAGDRDMLIRELRQLKVQVLPDDLPADSQASEPLVKEAMKQSVFSVHLLGRYYGRKMPGDPQKRSLPHIQFDLATEAGKPRIVWLADEIDESALPAEQKALVESVKHEEGSKTPLEWLRGNLQDLKDLIRSRLPPPAPPTPARSNAVPDGVVFITAHEKDIDRPEVRELLNYCASQGFETFASALTDAEDSREKRDEAYIRQADGLLILYGHSKRDWVTDRAFRAVQSATRRKRRPLVPAVLDVPPPPEEKPALLFQGQTVLILDARNCFSPEVLNPFFDRIRARRAR